MERQLLPLPEHADPVYQKMVDAFHGNSSTWREINRLLRDAIVRHATRSCPYYRLRLDPGGQPFSSIPLLSKGLVREHFESLLAEGVPEERRVRKVTSGSTGEPLVFYRDSSQGPMEDLSAQRLLKRLHEVPPAATMVWVAAQPHAAPGDSVARLPLPRRVMGWLRRTGPQRDPEVHPVGIRGLTPAHLVTELNTWARFRTYWLYGHASAMEWIAEQIEERGLSFRPPARIITTSDVLTVRAHERISRVFGCPVHSWYGSHEFNGFLAGTLPGTRRYVFNPLLAYVEVTDDHGRPVPPGATGRLLITDLNNYVFPFIRYDTGDLATSAGDEFVGGWKVVDAIEGRSSEVIRLPSGRIVSGVTLGALLFQIHDFDPLIRFYQCAQIEANRLELRVVWRGGPWPDAPSRIASAMRTITDTDTVIEVRGVEALETLPSGKVWLVRPLPEETLRPVRSS